MTEFSRNQADSFRTPAAGSGPAPTHLPAGALRFHPLSYADPHGRLFTAGDGLYRGVPAASVEFCTRLFESGAVGALVEKQLLVPTRRAALTAEGYAAVLEHQRVPYVSYPYEWSAEMLRAAALHILAVLEELSTRGLTLKDAHSWNVLFEGTRPVFVDFGSIAAAPADGGWLPYVEQEFQEYCLHPLAMMGGGHDRIARALMRDFESGISIHTCATLAGLGVPQRPPGAAPFAWYRELIAAYNFRPGGTPWSEYYQDAFPPLEPDAAWTAKHHAVHRLLQQHRPASVLDIGSNRGWFALLAAAQGARTVAFDTDPICINALFADAAERRLDVQPLVMSFVTPSPRYGLAGGIMAAAEERLPCDLVLALALVHHLVFKMHLNFDQIAAGLAVYARKALVVEFPPADDAHVKQWMTARHAWYTQENFIAALRRHFPKVSVVTSDPAPRMLLVCER